MRYLWYSFIAIVTIGLIGGGVLAIWMASLSVPDLASFESRQVQQSTKIFDRTGEVLLYEMNKDVNRTIVDFSQISPAVKNATIAIEDDSFFEHYGVEPTAIVRATLENLFALGFEQGGSTITQQVVKNTLLTNEKTITRKLKEWVLALKLEQKYSKEQILTLYLNEVPYGGNVYGVQEAADRFFGVDADELTTAQAAYLAALPKAPTYYSPYGNHRDALEQRKDLVLRQMQQNGFISQEEFSNAKTASVTFQDRPEQNIRAPHFVFHVVEKLEERFGRQQLAAEGYRVRTTLNWELQQEAQAIASSTAHANAERFNAENASIVAVQPDTGDILTMVGSRDYFDDDIDGSFNVATALRQPGSAFKPFVYAQAINEGYTPETTVFDLKTQFTSSCDPDNFTSDDDCYAPRNYDGEFHGPVTFREALAQSINIPSVKALYLTGVQDALALARSMGITTLTNPQQYGLTLVLGGGEVRPLEMASAYATFATGGVHHPHRAIQTVSTAGGESVWEPDRDHNRALPKETAAAISDMLSDNAARTPAFGPDSPLHFPDRSVAAKTGTTNEYRDAWTVGYSPNIAVAAWAGNNDNTSMEKKVAGFIVTPMWREFMDTALKTTSQEDFPPAPPVSDEIKPMLRGTWLGNETFTIDTISGKLATQYTPEETRKEIVVPDVHSILHWVQPDNPRGPIPETPTDSPQYEQWEYSVRKWAEDRTLGDIDTQRPSSTDDVHTPESMPTVTIEAPDDGATVKRNQRIRVRIDATGEYPLQKAHYRLDGQLLGTSIQTPQTFTFVPANLDITPGEHTLSVVAIDTVYNRDETSIRITVTE